MLRIGFEMKGHGKTVFHYTYKECGHTCTKSSEPVDFFFKNLPRQRRRDLPRPTLDRGAVMHDMPGVVDGVVADGDDPAALSLRAGTLLDALSVLLSENPSRA